MTPERKFFCEFAKVFDSTVDNGTKSKKLFQVYSRKEVNRLQESALPIPSSEIKQSPGKNAGKNLEKEK